MTASLRDIKVYTTFPHPCSYLPGREATTLFIDPRQSISQELYTRLSEIGFRRSGDHVYRPHCARCTACIPSRVPVAAFSRGRSLERIWRRNQDLSVQEADSIFDDETFALYQHYIEVRHADGDMHPPDRDQYQAFLNNGLGCTRYFKVHEGQDLIAVIVSDQMDDGLSAIYTFYNPDPQYAKRSLGSFAVLYQLELARQQQLEFVYLGYWIQNCDKMNYKARFKPLELLTAGNWQLRERLPTGGDVTRHDIPLKMLDELL